jgi:nicotinamidase-related amidase
MDGVLPVVAALANRHPERTVFTRSIAPERPDQMPGMWRRYYRCWRVATRERLDLRLLELMPPLAALCPPATVIDKTRYSVFAEPRLIEHLRQRETGALIVSGSETDVCVLATVLDAVDIGYRVIVVRDAICSSSDEGHENAHAALPYPIYGADRDGRRRDNPRAVGMTSDRASSRLGVLIDLAQCELGERFVGLPFLNERHLQKFHRLVQAELSGPRFECAVAGDLVMLDRLRRG